MPAPYTAKLHAWWHLADAAYTAAAPLLSAPQQDIPQTRAALAYTAGVLYGWNSLDAVGHLQHVLDARHPDGGWGLDFPWDNAWSGAIDYPAGTTYLITTAEHVGTTLLAFGNSVPDAYDQLVIDTAKLVFSWPLCGDGKGPRYSLAHDSVSNPTVWNVAAGAAWFLRLVVPYGTTADGMAWRDRANGWLATHNGAYRTPVYGWPYSAAATTPRQDSQHNAICAEVGWQSGGHTSTVAGHTITDQGITGAQRTTWGEADWVLGAARLLGLPGWVANPDTHFARVAAGLDLAGMQNARYMTQLARYAARVHVTYGG